MPNCNGIPKTAKETFNAVNALMNGEEEVVIGNYKLKADENWFCEGKTIIIKDNNNDNFLLAVERETSCFSDDHEYKATYPTCDPNVIYRQSSMQRNSCIIWKDIDLSTETCATNTSQASAIETLKSILEVQDTANPR